MKLYYSPGACSLADHIAMHEAGLPLELVKVDLKTHKLEDGRSFLDINPKGYVPALQFDDGELLTENVAILSWVADQKPELVPAGHLGRYRMLEILAYFSSELHKAFHPLFVPQASEADKRQARAAVEKKLRFVATQFKGPYLFGAHMSAADAYLFVMLTWAMDMGLDVPDALAAFAERMRERAAVKQALAHEGLE